MKVMLWAVGLWLGSAAIALFAALVGAIAAGPTVAAGERAVVALGLLDLALASGASVAFAFASRSLAPAPRWSARAGFVLLEFSTLAAIALVTVILFNR